MNTKSILERIKNAYKVKTYKELANKLKVSKKLYSQLEKEK